MTNIGQDTTAEVKISVDNLYRDETYTDLKIASIRRLSPVNPDGSQDYSRKPIFIGFTQLMTPDGPIPLQFHIDAKNLKQGWENFPYAMNHAMKKMIEEAEEMQRKESSRIIVPESTGGIIQETK